MSQAWKRRICKRRTGLCTKNYPVPDTILAGGCVRSVLPPGYFTNGVPSRERLLYYAMKPQPPTPEQTPAPTARPLTFYHQQLLQIRQAHFYPYPVYRQVKQARAFMDLHYGRPLDLTATARAGELSKFHFIRLFKRAYGTTPHQYLSDVRINQAKKLLLTVATVMEVCLAVGFESPSSFTGFFKKATGRTPSEYRRRKKSNF